HRPGALPADERQGSVFPAGRPELVERPDDAGPTEVDVVRILVLLPVTWVPWPAAPVEGCLRVRNDHPDRLFGARLVPLLHREPFVLDGPEELSQRRRGETRATRGASRGRSRAAGSPASPRRSA